MALLWQQFKSICLLQGSTGSLHAIYSLPVDELVVCLRVLFAKWIETSIGKVSPKTFKRGLQFQILKKLRQTSTESTDTETLHHSTHLSKYMSLLSGYKSNQEVDALHSKFIKCLLEEYEIVRLRNMNGDLDVAIRGVMEALEAHPSTAGSDNGINTMKNIISNQYMHLQRLETDLTQLITTLKSSRGRFYEWHNEYGREVLQPEENVFLLITHTLLDNGAEIIRMKRNLEQKFNEIVAGVSSMTENMLSYLTLYERLHVFSHRAAENFECAGIEDMGVRVEASVQYLQRLCACVEDLRTFDFQNIRAVNYDVIVNSNSQNERAELMVPELYINTFDTFLPPLQAQVQTLYNNFTLIVDCQPPTVFMLGSRRPISLRIFNLNNVFTDSLKINVHLVNEHTVRDIRTSKTIPSNIPSPGTMIITNPVCSTIPIGRGRPNRSITPTRRRTSSTSTTKLMVARSVVTLQEQCSPDKKCFLIRKELIIKTIERNFQKANVQQRAFRGGRRPGRLSQKENEGSENVTSEKVALLFVMTYTINNQEKQVWAISLPMIVAAHGSQNEKAWMTMAWDDALATPKRLGFEVEKKANWSQIIQLLKGTFEVLVGEPLKAAHVQYLRTKAQQHLGNDFPNDISKKGLSEDGADKISFWSWFFKASLVVKESGHFNSAWKNGYIEGFIEYEDARDLLLGANVQPGTFIVRFSDAQPGSVTLVFMSFDRKIYKVKPVEVYKSKSIADATTALQNLLNIRDSTQQREIFLRVFPNICKKKAFDKFYPKLADSQKSSDAAMIDKGYVPVLNTIPVLPMQPRNDNDNRSGSIELRCSGSSGSSNVPMQLDMNAPSTVTSNITDHFDDADLHLPPPAFEGMDTDVERSDAVVLLDLEAKLFSHDAF